MVTFRIHIYVLENKSFAYQALPAHVFSVRHSSRLKKPVRGLMWRLRISQRARTEEILVPTVLLSIRRTFASDRRLDLVTVVLPALPIIQNLQGF